MTLGRVAAFAGLALVLAGCASIQMPGEPCVFEFPFVNDYDVINRMTFDWDDSYVTNRSCVYRQELAGPLSGLAASVYGFRLADDIRTLEGLGFAREKMRRCYGRNVDYHHPKYGRDRVGYTIASRPSRLPCADYEILLVAVRGTFGRDEWLSNLNIANTWGAAPEPDLKTLPLLHEGFSRAAESVLEALAEYVATNRIDLSRAKILVTGHSRGAAVANLIGARLDDAPADTPFATVNRDNVFVYTFATPNVTIRRDDSVRQAKYGNIFNVISPEDMVPNVPIAEWGSARYGKDLFLRSYAHLPFLGSWTDSGYSDMKDAYRESCGYDYYHLLFGSDVVEGSVRFAASVMPTVADCYWVTPKMRAEGNFTSIHSFIEMVLWRTMVGVDEQPRDITLAGDVKRLANAYSQITNSDGEEDLKKLDRTIELINPFSKGDAQPFDPDGRDFSRQPGFTDVGWMITCTHSFETYVAWMKSAAQNGPEAVFLNWEEAPCPEK